MIAQGFGFAGDFPKEWNNSVYFRLRKIPCKFKEQERAHLSREKCGLTQTPSWPVSNAAKYKEKCEATVLTPFSSGSVSNLEKELSELMRKAVLIPFSSGSVSNRRCTWTR